MSKTYGRLKIETENGDFIYLKCVTEREKEVVINVIHNLTDGEAFRV